MITRAWNLARVARAERVALRFWEKGKGDTVSPFKISSSLTSNLAC